MISTHYTIRNLLKLRLLASMVLIVVSCTMQKAQPLTNVKEGIKGYVFKKSGNQMPMKGKPASAQGKGLMCELLIHKATTVQQVSGQSPLFSEIRTSLIARVKTDSTGFYTLALPPGRYSIFVKQGTKYYAAETNGNGTLNIAEVFAGKVTTRNITLTTGAVY
jgi:hypothetical protein